MVATPYTGLDGTVEVGGAVVASCRSWSMTIDMDPQDVGGFGSQWEIQKPGRKSANGSVEAVWASGDASGQGAIQTAAENSTVVALTLGIDGTHSYVLDAYITSLEVGAEYDGVTTFNFDFVNGGVDGPTTLASHG